MLGVTVCAASNHAHAQLLSYSTPRGAAHVARASGALGHATASLADRRSSFFRLLSIGDPDRTHAPALCATSHVGSTCSSVGAVIIMQLFALPFKPSPHYPLCGAEQPRSRSPWSSELQVLAATGMLLPSVVHISIHYQLLGPSNNSGVLSALSAVVFRSGNDLFHSTNSTTPKLRCCGN